MNPVNRLPLEQVEIELKFRTSSIFFCLRQKKCTQTYTKSLYFLFAASFIEVKNVLENFNKYEISCASFHPIDPVLACGLQDARVILLHAANHFVSFSEWKIKGNLRGGGEKLSLAWNVGSISIFLLFI